MVEYLGGYEDNKELFLTCQDGKVVISPEPTDNDLQVAGWNIELNSLMPFVRKANSILGKDIINKTYFCYYNFDLFYGSLNDCIKFLNQKGTLIPKVVISALKRYILETFN